MRFLLAACIWLVSAALALPFYLKTWWPPAPISEHARTVDGQFFLTLIVTGITFILAQGALGWAVFQFGRQRPEAASYNHGNNTMEVVWTTITGVLFIGATLAGQHVWAAVHTQGPPPGAMQVEVTGQQFAWHIRYSGPDGKFGALDIKQINDQSGNPLGIDSKDPAGKDDIVSATMPVPVGRPVDLILRTKDVTHAFFVPELRLKQDTVPGMITRLHFTAEKTGVYEIPCTELCGLGHYKMRSFLEVMEPAAFENWIQEKLKEKSQ